MRFDTEETVAFPRAFVLGLTLEEGSPVARLVMVRCVGVWQTLATAEATTSGGGIDSREGATAVGGGKHVIGVQATVSTRPHGILTAMVQQGLAINALMAQICRIGAIHRPRRGLNFILLDQRVMWSRAIDARGSGGFRGGSGKGLSTRFPPLAASMFLPLLVGSILCGRGLVVARSGED